MIPDTIQRNHILQAIEKIDVEGVPKKYKSVRFDLLYDGKRFPPKFVISLAHIFVNGEILPVSEFSGGVETNNFLISRGFEIVSKNSYWWVNHKQTHKEEISGGYIWSPKMNKNGATNQTYLNLTRVQINDVVFSYADGEIKAIGVVSQRFRNCDRPLEFGGIGEQWDKDGWLVEINWKILKNPFSPKSYITQIASLLPEKNSPIQRNGNGNQGCYLASISDELGELLIYFAQIDKTELEVLQDEIEQATAEEKEEDAIKQQSIEEVEKEQLIKARRGQGIFRANLELIEKGCRLTEITDKRFLIASHIKSWKDSTNEEKLDGNNGLFLSPHVDKLFDRGWISFTDDGKILCSNDEIKEIMRIWELDFNKNVGDFNEKQKEYLAYHRENIFKGG